MRLYAFVGRLIFPVLLPIMRPLLRKSERTYVALICDGRVLLVKNWLARNTWRLPGGGITKNENTTQALCREIHEELGIKLESSKLHLLSSDLYKSDNLNFMSHWFYYQLEVIPPLKVQSFEITSHMWTNKIPDKMPEEVRNVLRKLKSLKMLY